MATRVAINGYGRIGRCFLRALIESPSAGNLQVVAINEPANLESMAYLTRLARAPLKWGPAPPRSKTSPLSSPLVEIFRGKRLAQQQGACRTSS